MEPTIKLRVLAGRHAGSTQVIDQKAVVVGSSLDADIVLTDPSVFATHFQLTAGDTVVELAPLEGKITVGGRTILPDSKVKARYPARCAFGEAEIEVSRTLASGKPSAASLMKMGSFALISLVAAAKIYFDMSGRRPSPETDHPIVASRKQGPEPLPADLAKTAADSLYQQLQLVSIDSVAIKAGAGIVSATGTVDPEQNHDWQASQVWFDEHFGQSLLLQTDVNVVPKKPIKAPLGIQAVWSGKIPYLIDDDGNKQFEGSTLRDHWILEKIQADKVLIRKGNEQVVLKF